MPHYFSERTQDPLQFRRCDDGSDETLTSKNLAEKATLKGIGKLEAIETVHLKFALTKKFGTAKFHFSRAWTVPSIVQHLSSSHTDRLKKLITNSE